MSAKKSYPRADVEELAAVSKNEDQPAIVDPTPTVSPAQSQDPTLPPHPEVTGALMTKRYKMFVFISLVVTQAVTNFDSGAVGAVIGEHGPMSREFHSSGSLDGILASIAYLGNTIGGSMCGYMFRNYNSKAVIAHSLFIHAAFSLAFAASPHISLAIIARFFMGITQAFTVVYTPVWVDEFAPKATATTWMALAQAGVPLGIMSGYLTAGLIAANTNESWRVAFFVKVFLLLPVVSIFYIMRSDALQTGHRGSAAQAAKVEGMSRKALKRLLSNSLYVSVVFALCSLYFVVTALQLWVTAYLLLPPISANLNLIVASFGITSATGPVLGVILGGIVLDKIGGYQNHIDRAAMLGAVCGVVAVACAVISLLVTNFWVFIVLVWLLLFFGGAIVPTCTGLLMSGVEKDLRNLASSFGAMTFSLLGYFLGPLLCGLIAEVMDLKWGFRLVMLWSVVAVFSMVNAAIVARRLVREGKGKPTDSGNTNPNDPTVKNGSRLEAPEDAEGSVVPNTTFGATVNQYSIGLGVLETIRNQEEQYSPKDGEAPVFS